MARLAAIVAVIAVAGLVAVAILALTEGDDEGAPRELQAVGQAEVRVPPDLAIVRLGVTARAADARAATSEASEALRQVIGAVRGAGAAELQTLPVRVRRAPMPPRPDGPPEPAARQEFVASQSIEVRLRDLESAGAVIDAAVDAGANQVDGPRFTLADPAQARRAALADAVREARETASAMAAAAGVELGEAVQVQEQTTGPIAREVTTQRSAAAEAAEPPTEPGPVTVTARATVTFAID